MFIKTSVSTISSPNRPIPLFVDYFGGVPNYTQEAPPAGETAVEYVVNGD